jgi:hypothetical protein
MARHLFGPLLAPHPVLVQAVTLREAAMSLIVQSRGVIATAEEAQNDAFAARARAQLVMDAVHERRRLRR